MDAYNNPSFLPAAWEGPRAADDGGPGSVGEKVQLVGAVLTGATALP